jgi:hypothetical protein
MFHVAPAIRETVASRNIGCQKPSDRGIQHLNNKLNCLGFLFFSLMEIDGTHSAFLFARRRSPLR